LGKLVEADHIYVNPKVSDLTKTLSCVDYKSARVGAKSS